MSFSSSESLLNFFKGGTSADELLKSQKIIKKIFIGLSHLEQNTGNILARMIFGDEVSHASFFFMMDEKLSEKGILVQYGKYEYIKNKKEVLGNNVNAIGYPYEEKGGLIFGEIEYKLYKKEFCSICSIKPKLDHRQMTLKNFIEEIKKEGRWDLKSYSFLTNNCKHFVAAGIRILKPKYNNDLIDVIDVTYFIGKKKEEDGIPNEIIKELKKNEYLN